MTDPHAIIGQLSQQIEILRSRISEMENLEQEYMRKLQRLEEKEAFNFALFQYNPVLTVIVDQEGKVVKSNTAKRSSGDRLPNIGDIMYRDYAARHEIDMYKELMECIKLGQTKRFPELKYDGKVLSVTIAPFPKGAIITSHDITDQKKVESDRISLITDLRRALDEVETLRGLLPICASCKKIRDDKGYWSHIEVYISKHTLADFTHTMCPDCIKKYYPDYWEKIQKQKRDAQIESSIPS
jgi:hypothetical protein